MAPSRKRLFFVVAIAAGAMTTPAAAAETRAGAAGRYRVEYATYLGGSAWDQAREIIVYPDGSVLVGAQTCSDRMPTTPGVVQPRYAGDDPALGHGGVYGGDCYLARLAPDGRTMIAATYFGGSKQERNVYGMGLDSAGNVVFSTLLGGSDGENCLMPTVIPGGNICVVGNSSSDDFPTTPDALQKQRRGGDDAVLAIVSPDGAKLLYATYFGGSGDEMFRSIALGPKGELYLVGSTSSDDFPVTPGAFQPRHAGKGDAFVMKLVPER